MADERESGENEKSESDKGRTFWDVLVLAISSKGLVRLLLSLGAIYMLLSYLDIINLRYDDGLKVRIGLDPVKIQEENNLKQAAEADRKTKQKYQDLFKKIKGDWLASAQFSYDRNQKTYDCSSKTNMTYKTNIAEYDASNNLGQLTVIITGERDASFGLHIDSGDEEEKHRSRTECYKNLDVYDGGKTYWNLHLDGSFTLDETSQKFVSKLVQSNCTSGCLEESINFELLPSGSFAYRGRAFGFSNENVDLTLHMSQ
jgi:hypothetical protein